MYFKFGVLIVVSAAVSTFSPVMFAEGGEAGPGGKRIPWTTSRITGSPTPPAPYTTEQVFPKLSFQRPVLLSAAPGTERLFIAELKGKICSFENRPDVERPDLFADLTKAAAPATRVYGLAFHPDFATNRFCYICYIIGDKLEGGTLVSRFKVTGDDVPRVDLSSEAVLLRWRSGGHNGGCLKFGPDGYLYISTGDGGPPFPPDPLESGQDLTNVRSSILRIDVDRTSGDKPYAIPANNPFVDLDGARGEVWAYGFRNPWRMSFDPATKALWVGDVGWELWEMVYRVQRGGNYGWSLVEGPQPVYDERTRGPTPILPPTVEHSHIEARSITGGYVYHGKRLKELAGAYIYGDYVTGKIWGIRHDGQQLTWQKELVDTPLQIICFGVDHSGELYIVGYDGTIHRLSPRQQAAANADFPKKLSRTGLFTSVEKHIVAPGIIPYSINAEPWADGATAERFVALPDNSKLEVYQTSNAQIGYLKGNWKYPTDAVLMKTISLELEAGNPESRRRLETQILHYDVDTWRGYTYVWNDEQTDATLAPPEGSERSFKVEDPDAPGGHRVQAWRFPSRNECIICHTTRGGSVYGFKPAQLDKDHDYGGTTTNQLAALQQLGLFAGPVEKVRKIPNPYDADVPLEDRARAYLHVNCAHCHQRGGGGTAAIELPYKLSMQDTHLLGARPTQGTFGIYSAEVLVPGDPYRSVLYYRMAKLGRGRMPYFGSSRVDPNGLQLIHDWIASMPKAEDSTQDSAARLRQRQRVLLQRLSSGSTEQPRDNLQSVEQLLSTTSGALQLAQAIDRGTVDLTTRKFVIETAAAHTDVQIRDLFERFLPAQRRSKRLGNSIDSESLLAIRGDAGRGERLFLVAQGIQCRNCHRVGEQGRSVGPDLNEIGKKYDRAQLLDSILNPSKKIDPKFMTYVVETVDGRVHSGLLVKKDAKQVVLKDSQGNEVRVATEDVNLLVTQRQSIMPDLLLRDMTAQQVADLLEFLQSLK